MLSFGKLLAQQKRITPFFNPLLAASTTNPMMMASRPFAIAHDGHDRHYRLKTKMDEEMNFPHKYASFMRVLGSEYDVNSEDHIQNFNKMQQYIVNLEEATQETMNISRREKKKLEQRDKFDARTRIRKLLDRGSPFMAIGALAGCEDGIPAGNLVAGIGVI